MARRNNKDKDNKRWVWLIRTIKSNGFTSGAEVGCANGTTSHRVLKNCPGFHLFAIDKWEKIERGPEAEGVGGGRFVDENYKGCYNWDPVEGWKRFNRACRPYSDRLTILRGDSVDMASHVVDGSLDIVFIDADHRYDGVLRDLAAWAPKLKEGGVLCGHDIHLPGVLRAVTEKVPDFKEAGIDHVWYAEKEDYVD